MKSLKKNSFLSDHYSKKAQTFDSRDLCRSRNYTPERPSPDGGGILLIRFFSGQKIKPRAGIAPENQLLFSNPIKCFLPILQIIFNLIETGSFFNLE